MDVSWLVAVHWSQSASGATREQNAGFIPQSLNTCVDA